ncbi:MAG TPA: hypothetical protein VGL70_21625 [Candidatus Binatia bacterium]|jgi:hypothetical protein
MDSPYTIWRRSIPEPEGFIEIPQVDDLLARLGDDELAEKMESILEVVKAEQQRGVHDDGSEEKLADEIQRFADMKAACQLLEQRGRTDLLEKILGKD